MADAHALTKFSGTPMGSALRFSITDDPAQSVLDIDRNWSFARLSCLVSEQRFNATPVEAPDISVHCDDINSQDCRSII
jgi:hypothetical protein